jgi:hypothetical protein
MDLLFIASSIIFFVSVSGIWITTKLGNVLLLQVFGAIVILLIVPFTITLLGYLKERVDKVVIASLVAILFYLFLELSLDYILRIPFREILVLHILYIVVFYVAAFNMVGVSFRIDRRMGWLVTIPFWASFGSLIFLFLP